MSRKPYECFRCRDNGFPNTMVYLAGKDDSGKTVYVEEDGTAHQHRSKNGTLYVFYEYIQQALCRMQ